MNTTVTHHRGSYSVEVTTVASVKAALGERDFVITDHNVRNALALGDDVFSVEPGEQSKSVTTFGQALEWLASRAYRDSMVVAIGGGVVGDLAGFVASSFMRGIPVVHVPTSLLAMVDSSVGGKVGIDLAAGKNLAGAFWPPAQVHIPLDSLKTLPEREFINGAAEVWKYGAIMDSELFGRLTAQKLTVDDADLGEVVMRCVELKKQVVEADEFEQSGLRAILNFGHTVGHAIEHALGYEGLLHGEAVAIGMVAETRLAADLGLCDRGLSTVLSKGLESQGLPTRFPAGLDRGELVRSMRRDKKADRNGLAFSFVTGVGQCKLFTGLSESDVINTLEEL